MAGKHINNAKGMICVTSKTKERIYFGICIFCVLLCAALLLSTFLGHGSIAPASAMHAPQTRLTAVETKQAPNGTMQDVTITEQQMSEAIIKYLPKNTPLRDVKIEISEGGELELEAVLGVPDLKKFAEEKGIKLGWQEKAFIKLLPETFSFEVELLCETCEEGGLLSCVPESLTLHETEFDLTKLPTGLFDNVTTAINKVLTDSGLFFNRIVFTDGALILSYQ